MIIGWPFYDGIGRVTEFGWFVTESVWRVFEEWCVTEFRWSVTESVSLCDGIRVVV